MQNGSSVKVGLVTKRLIRAAQTELTEQVVCDIRDGPLSVKLPRIALAL